MQKNSVTRFSFGSTSAIITSLAIIISMDTLTDAKLGIIGSLLVVALADNISDTLGIHIYQESEGCSQKKIWISTLTNFLARFIVSLGFIAIIYFLPLQHAVIFSILYGLLILALITYIISVRKNKNPLIAILEHFIIALVVMFLSHYFSNFIISLFN